MATYLSQILNKPIWDSKGQQVGRCTDILVAETGNGYPVLRAIAANRPHEGELLIPADHVAWLSPSIILNRADIAPFHPRGNELWLKRQVLDRQIVDTEGRRLVRVNDLQLTRIAPDGRYYLVGVGIGTLSLVRRLGIENATVRLLKAVRRDPADKIIPWQDVASVQPDAPIRLAVSRDKIREFHPVDLAEIVTELDRESGQALLESLDNETVAETMSEIDPDLQATILTALEPARAADVLEEMAPDDAADLLASLEEDDRSELLELMEDEEAGDVTKLLAYPEDSAGGIMTTEFATLPVGLRAGEALDHLRASPEAQEDEALYYLHVVDELGKLRGVVALRDLVMADRTAPIEEIMEDHPVTVEPQTPQGEVARLIAKYNLLAVPVVDEDGKLLGIVTVDDAIDAIIPTAWKKRLPRFY